MGRTLPGQLTHTPRGQEDAPSRKMGHPWLKSKGYWGHQKLCGEASWSKQGISPPRRTAKEAWHFTPASSSSPCLPSALTVHLD